MTNEIFDSLFPHRKMRKSQEKGIPEMYSRVKDGEWVLLEGATGTGKTIFTLTSLLPLVLREDSDYERILVVTNVKQQQEIFENEVRKINTNTDHTIDSITLKGKDKLCTYVDSGEISEKAIYWKCDELRKGTRELNELSSYKKLKDKSRIRGGKYPYSEDKIPEFLNKEYCPFYANFLSNMNNDRLFEEEFGGSLKTEELLEESSEKGLCPHATAGRLMEESDVVIANYNHFLDERTVNNYTENLIDEETLVIVDEAHNLVPEARRHLSHTNSLKTFNKSIRELLTLEMFLKLPNVEDISKIDNSKLKKIEKRSFIEFSGPGEFQKCLSGLNNILQRSDYTLDEVSAAKDFFKQLSQNAKKIMGENPEEDIVSLRDPEKIEQDRLSDWIHLYLKDSEIGKKDLKELEKLTTKMLTQCCMASSRIDRIPEFASQDTFDFVNKWIVYNHKNYFRTIEQDHENKNKSILKIYNTVPREELSERLNKFGGGVLMSATLEPLDLYSEEIGLENTHEMTYGLPFPEEKRLSLSVDLPKYTYSNRGRPFSANKPVEDNIVRQEYLDSTKRVIKSTQGNTMIIMPSYSEAEWISELLIRDSEIPEEVITDKSSSFDETKELKEKFIQGDDKILATSARGTLTEGIDYVGDMLQNVIVIGVPIENTQGAYSKAVLTSYKSEFSRQKGFKLAFVLPAVRKTRQAIGRVIRSEEDRGLRVLMDKRYCRKGDVREFLGEEEQEEFQEVKPSNLQSFINLFWQNQKD